MNIDTKRYAIQDMQITEGWKLVEQFIKERIEGNKLQLMTCKLEEVMDKRNKIDAYNSIFIFMKEILEDEGETDESTD